MGINAPIPHQRIISKLIASLGHLYYAQKSIALEPLPETMIDQDKTSPVPDILLYDNERDTKPVIIEVTRTGTVDADMRKVRDLIDSQNYGIEEGFVYDYLSNVWRKYKKSFGEVTQDPSYCDALGLDLATLLK